MTLTHHLAQLAIDTKPEDIARDARQAAIKMSLDSLACAIGGAFEPGCTESADMVREWGGRNDATVWMHGGKVPLPNAVYAGSVMTHALDLDDVLISLHVQSLVFPTALCTAEFAGATGREYLDAMILGTEIAARVGFAWNDRRRGGPQAIGWLQTTTACGFGATAAACRLLGLDVKQTVHALGINYAQASGNRQGLADMTLVKRIQPALAARSAVWSACLAARGVTGPHRALEGEQGLFKVYQSAEPPTVDELMAPREGWEIERDSIKRYPSCGASHPMIEAALRLVTEHDIDPSEVERIEISWGGKPGNMLVGNAFELGDNPQVNAQFSAPYCVALAVVRRRQRIEDFKEANIRADTAVIEMARKVRMVAIDPPPEPVPMPDGSKPWRAVPHVVRIVMKSGDVHQDQVAPVEHFDPMAVSLDGVKTKLHECAAYCGRMSPQRAEEVIAAALALEGASSVEGVTGLLGG